MMTLFCIVCTLVGESGETVRYLRPAGGKWQTECTFTLRQEKTGATIESTTFRGQTRLTVRARYDGAKRLIAAEVLLLGGAGKKVATVQAADGKAKVLRAGQSAQEFDVPSHVIVTSAPDWTDTFLLCKRYDRKKQGKQSFACLWVHPVQPSQRLTFTIERVGADAITHAGRKVALDRHTIRLRGNSAYVAWADASGRMIKLVPMPYKDGATNWLIADGYEKSAAGLRP
jgi:hypothetical protein